MANDAAIREETAAGAAEAALARAVREIFGRRCRSAWLSGSFVYEGARPGRSDIDVVVVLEDSVPVPADEAMLSLIGRFVEAYLAVHQRAGLDPDLDFPGEYVSTATVAEAIAWRGLAMDGGVASRFPPAVPSDYWLGRPDRWFNAWLSMTAFSRHLAGDDFYHETAKLAAWKTVARFLLLRAGGGRLSADCLWEGLDQFGVKPSYRALRPLEQEWLERALEELEGEGAVRLLDGRIEPVRERLCEWERELEAAIASRESDDAALLLPPSLHRGISSLAKERWAAQEGGQSQ